MKPLSPLSFVRGKLPTVTLVYGEDLQLIEEVREAVGGSVPAENLHRHTLEGIAKSKLSSNDNKGLFSADAPECFEITVDGKLSGTSERESKGGGGLDWLLAKAENTAPPDLLLIVLRQWERKQARTAWFKKLSAIGVCVQADRLMGVAGLEWIQRWAEAHHLSMTPDAARQLAYRDTRQPVRRQAGRRQAHAHRRDGPRHPRSRPPRPRRRREIRCLRPDPRHP